MPKTYRSPFYPSIQVHIDPKLAVRFVGGKATVEDKDLKAFEAWLDGPHGKPLGITEAPDQPMTDAKGRDIADELGPGYTPAEREAYRQARTQTAPPPPEDQRTEGVKTAASIPMVPPGMVVDDSVEVDPAALASAKEQQLANERAAAMGGGAPGPEDMGTEDTDGDDELDEPGTEDAYSDLSKDELQEIARERGLPVSGNKAELRARLRSGANE